MDDVDEKIADRMDEGITLQCFYCGEPIDEVANWGGVSYCDAECKDNQHQRFIKSEYDFSISE